MWTAASSRAPSRADLRLRLLAERAELASSAAASGVGAALASELRRVVEELEPECLGLYWPLRSEFNAAAALAADEKPANSQIALPFARRVPPEMHYRRWDGRPPGLCDELAIPTADGAPVVPDVVLVPCLGYTDAGFRLGYGGGYFDRWLAAHPHVCAVGVTYAAGRLDATDFAALDHDVRLALIVTEYGPVSAQ